MRFASFFAIGLLACTASATVNAACRTLKACERVCQCDRNEEMDCGTQHQCFRDCTCTGRPGTPPRRYPSPPPRYPSPPPYSRHGRRDVLEDAYNGYLVAREILENELLAAEDMI